MAEAPLYGGPTKRFFVSMLTRDIELDDAILDLIDNSVDGAMRQVKAKLRAKKPYEGFWAHLTVSAKGLSLIDNCGGIPDDRLEAAFRLGRPLTELDKDIPTIGMYGIGMKRALFKMGREAAVESSSPDGVRKVSYSKEWLDDQRADADQNWNLDIHRSGVRKDKGVKISVNDLKPEVSKQFQNASFVEDLKRKIAIHFGYLILRGFSIEVNKTKIKPETLYLYSSLGKKGALDPYDYVAEVSGVRVRVTVGFHRALPPPDELEDEEEVSRTRDQAGISVICNDRVILHNDTTFRTGWGTRTVPKFHNQFMAISGLISFLSNDADMLPVSTTKTGIEFESEVYDHALSICAEALKIFIGFTNKWKTRTSQTATYFDGAKRREAFFELALATEKGKALEKYHARRYKPQLPLPKTVKTQRRISFVKPITEIELVSEHLFNEVQPASDVGEACFDQILDEAKAAAK